MTAHVLAFFPSSGLDCVKILLCQDLTQSLHSCPHAPADLANAREEAPDSFPVLRGSGAQHARNLLDFRGGSFESGQEIVRYLLPEVQSLWRVLGADEEYMSLVFEVCLSACLPTMQA